MQNLAQKNHRYLKQFKIGIIGASLKEYEILSRIFSATECRTRWYVPVILSVKDINRCAEMDILMICGDNPNVIHAWENARAKHGSKSQELVLLSKSHVKRIKKYQMPSPVNPGKLIRLLDQYTIKELKFFPEFEIGGKQEALSESDLTAFENQARKKHLGDNKDRKNVLVIDDSISVRKQMLIEFELLDDSVELSKNAEEALQLIQTKRYDIIFLDVVMPGIDGYTACKKIKRSPLNKNTPVIMLTSKSSSFDKIKGALAGCDAYLIKPINHNDFEAIYQKHTTPREVAARGQS